MGYYHVESKVKIANLKVGMYVSRLDRPWLETPFLFQGFYIRTTSEVDTLSKYCLYVFIDHDKAPYQSQLQNIPAAGQKTNRIADLPKAIIRYQDTKLVEDEIKFAKECHSSLITQVEQMMQDAGNDKALEISKMKLLVKDMVTSIVRNPDAFLWLTKLKCIDTYAYKHSIDSATLAVAFGRHLGLSVNELNHLAVGVMLCDIGKTKLPRGLLSKPGRLSEEEFELVKTHVEHSVSIMQQSGNMSTKSIEIAMHHHERANGSGYPQGLKGSQIPVFSRIAAIVDCYDAITTERSYCKALSPLNAIRCLYEWRDIEFQSELVEEFIQCLGIFPTGSIVELSSGEIGIVLSQNRTRRLRPRVMLVLDHKHVMIHALPVIDLALVETDAESKPLEIVTTHEPWAFGIDPGAFFI